MKKSSHLQIIIFFAVFIHAQIAFCQENDFEVSAQYIGESFSNFKGGIRSGQTYLGLIDFGLSFNTSDIGLWKNGKFSALIENTHGGSPTGDYIGDLQVASNIENGDHTYLYELWYMHTFSKLAIKFGLMDLNADFHVSEVGALFLNSSLGTMPTVSLNMPVPIFPMTALGVFMQYKVSDNFKTIAGIWDGDPGDFESNPYNIKWTLNNRDGFLYVLETQYRLNKGTIKLGGLYHSGEFEDIADPMQTQNGNLELHLITDYTLIDKPKGTKGKLDAFLQLGYLPNKDINAYPFYLGAGFNLTGIFNKNADDVLGLGIASVITSKTLTNITPEMKWNETAIELTYYIPLTNNIAIQPDLQYIVNPGTTTRIDNAFTGFLRFYITTN